MHAISPVLVCKVIQLILTVAVVGETRELSGIPAHAASVLRRPLRARIIGSGFAITHARLAHHHRDRPDHNFVLRSILTLRTALLIGGEHGR
jgi:hypothetical protein